MIAPKYQGPLLWFVYRVPPEAPDKMKYQSDWKKHGWGNGRWESIKIPFKALAPCQHASHIHYSFIQHPFSYYHMSDSELHSIENKKNKTQFLSIKSSKCSRVVRRATINYTFDIGKGCPIYLVSKWLHKTVTSLVTTSRNVRELRAEAAWSKASR